MPYQEVVFTGNKAERETIQRRPLKACAGTVLLLAGLLTASVATGCGKGNFGEIPTSTPTPTPTPTPTSYSGPAFSLKSLYGTTPFSGASVQLYAAGSAGNGSAASALLSSPLQADSNGAVSFSAGYLCPAAGSQLYVVASGATPGNSAVSLMAALGPCGSFTSAGSSFVANEVTTVAAAYALAPFYKSGSGTLLGASSTNATGLANAFITAGTLANVATGSAVATTLPASAKAPTSLINTLANALNACAVQSANCSGLYAVSGGSPASTLDAIAALPRTPATNVAGVYKQSLLSTAFAPAVSSQPTDFTVFITYSGGGLSSPSGIAVDSTGAVWVSNYFGAASKFYTNGGAQFANGITGSGLNNSYGIAIDLSDNVWIPNEQPYAGTNSNGSAIIGSVTELSSTGAALSGTSGYTAGGMNYPTSTSVDPNGTVWVVQYGNSHVTLLNKSGVPLSGVAGYIEPTFAFPITVVTDSNHIGWIGDQEDQTVTRMSADATSVTGINCCNGPSGLAVDQNGKIWAANFYGNSVSVIAGDGTLLANGLYTGNGALYRPQGIAIDGGNNVFVANYRAPYITELTNAGASVSPAAGFGADANLLEAYGLTIDASGNVWVSSQGNDTVSKFIGLAVPVKTPVSGAARIP